jgi:hypothetical protein
MPRDAPVINTRFPRSSMVGAYAYRLCHCGAITYGLALGDIATIDSELRLVTALRRAARGRGGPLPSIAVADALLDERLRAHRVGYDPGCFCNPYLSKRGSVYGTSLSSGLLRSVTDDRHSIQLHSCLKTSKKGTPMNGPMNAKSTKRRMLKAGAAAATLVAVLLSSTGCTITCGGSLPGTISCS